MSQGTGKDAVLERMRAENPVSLERLEQGLGEEDLAAAMARAQAAGRFPAQPVPPGDGAAREFDRRVARRSRRVRLTLATAAAGACAFGASLLLLGGASPDGGARSAYAAAAVRVAEANPRLLVTAAGWRVTRAYGFEADSGELLFGDGSHRLELDWYPARFYRSYLNDRANVSPPQRWTLLGERATTVHYGGTDYATLLPPQGSVFVELRGSLASRAEYDDVLRSLRQVGVDAWLAAMPRALVGAGAGSPAVRRMLRGVPLPPEFDERSLPDRDFLSTRSQLGAKVTGAVACAWLERWLSATRSGDAAAAREAVAAMRSARHWPILLEMADEGGWKGASLPSPGRGWASLIQRYAAEIAHGRLDRGPAAYEITAAGVSYAVGPAYALALGCKAHYRRRGRP